MIESLYHYIRKYVSPQARRILFDTQPLISILLGTLLYFHRDLLERVTAYEVFYQLVSYNFMAFGFTIAALTIVFAVPNQRFVDFMFDASEHFPHRGVGPWEDALFVMSWNGVVHFLSLASSLLGMALSFDFSKDHSPKIFLLPDNTNAFVYSVFIALQSYALMQFLVTLLSVYFFCISYIRHLRTERVRQRVPAPPST
jgi:hypothetical protein